MSSPNEPTGGITPVDGSQVLPNTNSNYQAAPTDPIGHPQPLVPPGTYPPSGGTYPPTAPPPAPHLPPDAVQLLAAPPATLSPAAIQPAQVRGRGQLVTYVLVGVLAMAVLFGGGFWAGRASAPDNTARGQWPRQITGSGQLPDGIGQLPDGVQPLPDGQIPEQDGQNGSARFGRMMLSGTITKIDGNSITVKADDGTETTYTTDDQTTVSTVETGQVSDLQVGDEVAVAGDPSSLDGDNTVARSITKGDLGGRIFGGPPGQGGGPAVPTASPSTGS